MPLRYNYSFPVVQTKKPSILTLKALPPVGLDFLCEVNTLCVEDEELGQCIQELFVRQIGFQDGTVAKEVLPDFITVVRGQFACCSYQRRA